MHVERVDRRDASGRRLHFRPSAVMAAICAGLVLLLALWSVGYTEKPKTHKFKSISADKLDTVARKSDGPQLEFFRQHLLQPFLRVRVSDTEGSRAVQEHIRNQMKDLGWLVEDDTFTDDTPFGQKTFTNIVAVQNPSAKHRLVLACHFDSKYFSEFDFIGATDSAVPCAMIIDLARHLNAAFGSSKHKDVTLELIFFDGEEAFVSWTETDSLYGARHLASKREQTMVTGDDETPASQLEMIDLFVLLDLIGTRSTAFKNIYRRTEKLYERLQKIELRLAKEGLLEPAEAFQGKRSNTYFTGKQGGGYGEGIGDDHIPFLRRGVPIVHLISTPFPSVWHTADDNEAALHYATINNIGKVLRIFVVEYLQLSV